MGSSLLQDRREKELKEKQDKFPLVPGSYVRLLIGIGIIVLGFLLMMGGGAENDVDFSYEIFSFRRITLAPIVVLLGFVYIFWVIIRRPKKTGEDK